MAPRAVIVLIIVAAMLAGNWGSLRQATGKARAVYTLLLLYTLYTSAGYVTEHPLPNINALITACFQKPATAIDSMLKARRPATPGEAQ